MSSEAAIDLAMQQMAIKQHNDSLRHNSSAAALPSANHSEGSSDKLMPATSNQASVDQGLATGSMDSSLTNVTDKLDNAGLDHEIFNNPAFGQNMLSPFDSAFAPVSNLGASGSSLAIRPMYGHEGMRAPTFSGEVGAPEGVGIPGTPGNMPQSQH